LTDLGKELIGACNRLRILIDLSHLNERGFWDVAAISNAPLVATHSNAHALSPHRLQPALPLRRRDPLQARLRARL
jgi:membrane dipeptidase